MHVGYDRAISELLREPMSRTPPCDHLVQVYREPHELAESVADYLGAGFELGEPAVVVATETHLPLFREQLQQRGWSSAELESTGMLYLADAETTLAAIMDGRVPSFHRFVDVVGGLVDRAAASAPSGRIRVFGEMVDLLCRRGRPAAADALEDMWNRLAARRNFSLLCGYRVDVFDRHTQVTLLPQVCRSHSHVLPALDGERMEWAVETALTDTLGAADAQRVRARAARGSAEQRVPASQLALMWVSTRMPRTAERVLASARSHYLAAQAQPRGSYGVQSAPR